MNKWFSGSSDASPRNNGNMIMGYCPAILNYVKLLPLHGVDSWLLLHELVPLVGFSLLDPWPAAPHLLKIGCLKAGVPSSVLVAQGVVDSTLTVIWNRVMPFVPNHGPLVFLSYVARRISSICSTSRRSSTSYSSLAKPSLSFMALFLLFILYW